MVDSDIYIAGGCGKLFVASKTDRQQCVWNRIMGLGELSKILANCFCVILHMVIGTVGACFLVPAEGLEDDRYQEKKKW